MPVFAVVIGFHMTRMAESYAILWRGIHFHIVDVVNMIAILATNFARIVIASANHALEYIVECGGVWCKRNTAKPSWGRWPTRHNITTFARAIRTYIAICFREFFFILFSTNGTSQSDSLRSGFIKTLLRTIFTPFIAVIGKERFSTLWASFPNRSTLPHIRFTTRITSFRGATIRAIMRFTRTCLTNFIGFPTILARFFDWTTLPIGRYFSSSIFRTTRPRTVFCFMFTSGNNNKYFSTIEAGLLNFRLAIFGIWNTFFSHDIHLNGASPSAIGCCSGNAG